MSNIANQLVAVVATLMGFVAHDVLSERQAPDTAATNVAMVEAIDPIVTRSIDLDGVSADHFLDMSKSAEREAQRAPASRVTAAAPVREDVAATATEVAGISINDARSMAPAQQADLNTLR